MRALVLVVAVMLGCGTTPYEQRRWIRRGAFVAVPGVAISVLGGYTLATADPNEDETNGVLIGKAILAVGLGMFSLGAGMMIGGWVGGERTATPEPLSAQQLPDEPTTTDVTCRDRRASELRRAQTIADPDERAKALAAVVPCTR